MDATSQPAAATGSSETPASDAAIGTVAHDAFELARHWCALLEAEVALARSSFRALLIVALVLPVVALGTWLSLVALMAGTVYGLCGSWPLALLVVVLVQALLLLLLLRFSRRWSRDLTLARSRDALTRAMERMT